jgi:hypothetical protein
LPFAPSISILNNGFSISTTTCLTWGLFCNTTHQSPPLIVFRTKHTYISIKLGLEN